MDFTDYDVQWIKVSKLMSFCCADFRGHFDNEIVTVRKAEDNDWFGKRNDPHYQALVEDLARYGFQTPLSVNYYEGFNYLSDGHHCAAAAIELGIEYVPITYDYIYRADAKWGCGKDTYEIFTEV